MKITVLGSGPAMAIPRIGCRCKTCQDAQKSTRQNFVGAKLKRASGSKSKRTRSSVLLQWRGKNILLDCGPDILEQMEMARLKRPDAVLLTHGHADAAGGIDILASILREEKEKPFLLYAEKSVLRRILKISSLFHARPETILKNIYPQPIHPHQPISLFSLKIIPFRVEHALTPGFLTVGYFFPKKFAYISDFASIPPRTMKMLKKINVLFLDGAMWFGKKMAAHQNTEQSIKIAQTLGVKKLYLTQIGHSYPPHQIAQREINKFCQKNKIPFPVILAYDGLKIRILP